MFPVSGVCLRGKLHLLFGSQSGRPGWEKIFSRATRSSECQTQSVPDLLSTQSFHSRKLNYTTIHFGYFPIVACWEARYLMSGPGGQLNAMFGLISPEPVSFSPTCFPHIRAALGLGNIGSTAVRSTRILSCSGSQRLWDNEHTELSTFQENSVDGGYKYKFKGP